MLDKRLCQEKYILDTKEWKFLSVGCAFFLKTVISLFIKVFDPKTSAFRSYIQSNQWREFYKIWKIGLKCPWTCWACWQLQSKVGQWHINCARWQLIRSKWCRGERGLWMVSESLCHRCEVFHRWRLYFAWCPIWNDTLPHNHNAPVHYCVTPHVCQCTHHRRRDRRDFLVSLLFFTSLSRCFITARWGCRQVLTSGWYSRFVTAPTLLAPRPAGGRGRFLWRQIRQSMQPRLGLLANWRWLYGWGEDWQGGPGINRGKRSSENCVCTFLYCVWRQVGEMSLICWERPHRKGRLLMLENGS